MGLLQAVVGQLRTFTIGRVVTVQNRRMTMKTLSALLLLVLISVCVASHAIGSSGAPPARPSLNKSLNASDGGVSYNLIGAAMLE